MISQFGDVTKDIERRLADANAVKKARIHPLNALVAMRTYASGRGESSTWTPVHRITDALEETFYLGFDAIEPTGKTHMLALDISGSMTLGRIGGLPINAREASACMAMVTARTEREYVITGFSGSGGWGGHDSTQLSQLDITSKMRLQDVIKEIQRLPYGGTDISLPMEQAIANKLGIDAFVVYTDNELGMGRRHPFQALAAYRRELNRPEAKLITVATMATNFTVANPNDPGMLDIAGFDTAAPALMADFVR
jgi:60 kDa SS-A/Ro ribonucleoprotein